MNNCVTNSFIRLLLESVGITEEQTVALSKFMDCYNIKPCIQRDVLQPAVKGEKVGDSLIALMQFKTLETLAKTCGNALSDFDVKKIENYVLISKK